MHNMQNGYEKQVADIATRAQQMRDTLIAPVVDEKGEFIADNGVCGERITAAVANSVYEAAGDSAPMIASIHSSALRAYCKSRGRVPSDELLASAHKATENVMAVCTKHADGIKGVFESVDMQKAMSTTDGIMMRDRMISLILPVALQSISSDIVTLIPGQFNQSELFRVQRVAGSTFGDLKRGDVIGHNYNGRYSVMDQMAEVATGDGSRDEFIFDSAAAVGVKYPFKKKRIKIIHDRNIVATDDGNGNIFGAFPANGVTVNVSGNVDYSIGKITAKFSTAPTANIAIHFGFDVDIEKAPELIPKIDHAMDSRTLYPHESAIASSTTIQALWALRRELGLSADNMALVAMRNILSADKDHKILRDLNFFAMDSSEWVCDDYDGITQREHYETLKSVLLSIDSSLMMRTGTSGLVGIVGGIEAVNTFCYLPSPFFEPAPGYRKQAQAHYVGVLFGRFALYCNPQYESMECVCYARGTEMGESAYVHGDAIPALSFNHPVLGDLASRSTMWDLSYRDLQPFDGRKYITKLKVIRTR